MMKYLLLLVVAVAAHGQYGAATSVVSGNGAPIAAQCTNANNVGRVWARKDGGAINSTFYVCSSTGGSSFGWELVGGGSTPSGGAVGGASSVASGQVLYGTGAGVAGTSANLSFSNAASRLTVGNSLAADNAGILTQGSGTIRWQATPGGGGAFVIQNNSNTGIFFTNSSSTLASLANTGNLLLGTTTDDGANRLQVAGQIGIIGASFGQINNAVGDLFITNNAAASALIVRVNGVEGMRVASTSRNVLIGGSTDGGFKIDIQNSGSSGTLRAYDQTPTTGATSVIVRAGAGQSTTDLTQFVTLSNGTSGVRSNGSIFGGTAVAIGAVGGSTNPFGVLLGSGADIRWSNAASFGGGTPDISLYRASANTLQVGDGGSNSNGLLYLKGVRPVGSTVATLPTASGNTGMIATVTDATVTTIGTTVAGGGGNTVLVWSNGTNWRIYAN